MYFKQAAAHVYHVNDCVLSVWEMWSYQEIKSHISKTKTSAVLLLKQQRKVYVLLLAVKGCNQMKCLLHFRNAWLHPIMCIAHRHTQTHTLTVLHPVRLVPVSVETRATRPIIRDAAPPAMAGTSRTAGTRAVDCCCDCTPTDRPAAHTLLHKIFPDKYTHGRSSLGPANQTRIPFGAEGDTWYAHCFSFVGRYFFPFGQNCAQPCSFNHPGQMDDCKSVCSQVWKSCWLVARSSNIYCNDAPVEQQEHQRRREEASPTVITTLGTVVTTVPKVTWPVHFR